MAAFGVAACGNDNGTKASAETSLPAEPTAGQWVPWVLSAGSSVEVPAPPAAGSEKAKADLAELEKLATSRTDADRANVEKWGGPLPTKPWTEMILDFVSKSDKNPPLSSRNYALLHAAMYDATVSAWYWKYQYNVNAPSGVDLIGSVSPDPSYPSEHAAIAGVASKMLAYLYPKQASLRLDEMAEEAARSRVTAGANTTSDIEAGLALGRAVAEKVIAYARADGSDRKWDGKRPVGIGSGPQFWEPVPGVASPPIEPLAGSWKTWVMTSGNQFRPPPPPKFGSPEFVDAAEKLLEVRANLTPEQQQAAKFYAGEQGTPLPAGVVVDVSQADVLKAATASVGSQKRLSVPRSTRAMALITIAMADAGVAAWDAKFTYWNPRPENAIRDLGLDPNFKPIISTPRFPAYPSGSATYAGASQSVLTYLFPGQAADFKKRAEDQARSRIWGGIHWEYDEVTLPIGRTIGEMVVAHAKADGADR
ncbi:MAG: vanadium-dependent haloperoxidase [Acidimicrobiales bacterium]